MKKIALSYTWKGFHLSDEAKAWLLERNFGVEYRANVKRPNCAKSDEEWNEFTIWDLFDEVKYGNLNKLREDPLLIKCIETLGEKAGDGLVVEQYDDEKYVPVIERDGEYSDSENLVLEPFVSESKIKKCKNTKEIMRYLKSLGIWVEED